MRLYADPSFWCRGLTACRASCPAEGVRQAVAVAQLEYAAQGAAEGSLTLHLEPKTGHEVTQGMRDMVDSFFARHLTTRQLTEKADL